MNKRYIEAPEYSAEIACLPPSECIFLAGSITGAHDWQKEFVFEMRSKFPLGRRLIEQFNVFNPRRVDYSCLDPAIEREQIIWEYQCIHQCEHILFWFSHETLAPITLFELGSALNTHQHKNIYIGIDPEYKRKGDILIQTDLRNLSITHRIVNSKQDLLDQIIFLNDNRL